MLGGFIWQNATHRSMEPETSVASELDESEAASEEEPKKTWVNITNKPETVDGSVDGVDDETKMQTKIINEEYKIWKKNAVYLYDIMFA